MSAAERQIDLDDALLASAGAALAPDWLVHRARRKLDVPTVDVAALGVTVPAGWRVVPAALLPLLRPAAGITGAPGSYPVPGLNSALTETEEE